jgi:oligopeptide transport system substrate-binding protein
MKKSMLLILASILTISSVFASGSKEQASPAVENEITVNETKTNETIKDDEVVFTISNGAEPESLDPAEIQGTPEHRIYMTLFEGLVSIDPKTGNAAPGVAESWDVNEDDTQYTFHLRKTTWSDGVPITADDVVYSWLRELNPETGAPASWFPGRFVVGAEAYNSGEASSDAVQIRALDDYTFQVDLIGPFPFFIDALEHYSFAIVPKHTIEEFGDKWTSVENIVSNGPFVLEERVPQSYISVVPNDKYWDKDNVKLDRVVILTTDDENTSYNMYINNEIDWLTNVPTDKIDSAKMKDSYHVNAQLGTYYFNFQIKKFPLDNILVRKAIQYAIDRDAIVEGVTRAGEVPAWGLVPPLADYPTLDKPFDDDEEATAMAQEYLAEAGYPNGVGLPTITLLYNTSDSHKKVAEFIQQELKTKLGIKIELVNEEWGTYIADKSSGNYMLGRAGWYGDFQDPTTFLNVFTTAAASGGQFASAEYDDLLERASLTKTPSTRLDLLRQAEELLVNEDAAIMPIYYFVTSNMIDTDKWGGWYQNTMDYHPLKDIYLK